MVAMKLVSREEYSQFSQMLAQTALADREQLLEEYAERFERNLTLLGATALLDELQDGVPETLRDFQRAEIRVWMLTGDKLETALEVSKSCSLITSSYEVLECRPGPRPVR